MMQNTLSSIAPAPHVEGPAALLTQLRRLSLRALPRMFDPHAGLFVFRLGRDGEGLRPEGLSRRYSAIVLIGLADEDEADANGVLPRAKREELCRKLVEDAQRETNLGDAALACWAARAMGHASAERARARLDALYREDQPQPTVEISWVLAACAAAGEHAGDGDLPHRAAKRLLAVHRENAGTFPHVIGGAGTARAHISCFADLIYPIHALSHYHRVFDCQLAFRAAERCARRICDAQGPAGQWWWHYDVRSGAVTEGFPVYSVHQDAMAPMGLFALEEAGGESFQEPIERGLRWMIDVPELGGGCIIDDARDIIWRKVARREPRKLTRRLQAAASKLHPALRVPGVNVLFPPGAIDYEYRPYHLGWLLYAFPTGRCSRFAQLRARA